MTDPSRPDPQSPSNCSQDSGQLGLVNEYSALLDIFPGAVLVAKDPNCDFVEGNAQAEKLYRMEGGSNLSLNNATGDDNPYRIFEGQWPVAAEQLPLQTAAKLGKPVKDKQLTVRFADGREKEIMVNAAPLFDGDQAVCGAIATILDITDQTQDRHRLGDLTANLEARARNLAGEFVEQSNQLRALALQLTEAEHCERLRIARILHDRFQQLLVGAKFKLGTLGTRLVTGEQDELADLAGRIERIIDESLEATRNLAMELSTPVLYDGGLASAMHWLVDRMKSRQGLCIDAECEIPDDSLDQDLRVLFFDCIQELLLNIIKHAEVKNAVVRVWQDQDNQARIEVSDAGKGMDTSILEAAAGKQNSFGLFHLAQRVESIGGQIQIESTPGTGTTVRISAPLNSAPSRSPAALQGMGPLDPQENQPTAPAASILLAGGAPWMRDSIARLLRGWPEVSVVAQQEDVQRLENLAMVIQPDLVLALDVADGAIDSLARAIDRSESEMQILLLGNTPSDGDDLPACVSCLEPHATSRQLLTQIRALAGLGRSDS